MLKHLVAMHNIFDEHRGAYFSDANANRFFEETMAFLGDWTWLGNSADQSGDLLFSAVPKLHWLWHLAARCRFLNPRRVATFSGDDFVKPMKCLGASCSSGTALHNVPKMLMGKYRYALSLENEYV